MTKGAKQTGDSIRSDRMAPMRNLGRDVAVAYLRLSRKLSLKYHSQCQLDAGSDLEAEPGTSSSESTMAKTENPDPSNRVTRVKSGCITCRIRRVKCTSRGVELMGYS